MFQWVKTVFSKMSRYAVRAWDRWTNVIKGERKLFLAELMGSAMPLIEMVKDKNMTGEEKRKEVIGTLITIATKHALVAAGKIAAGEIKALCGVALEAQVLAMKVEEKK